MSQPVSSERTVAASRLLQGGAESHLRSVVKGVSWRIVGTIDTFAWSWLITHEPVKAGAIASLEVFTKVALFYAHERLWRIVAISPHARWRSLAKAVSWRFVGSLDTFFLSWIVTGNGQYAVSIASVEALTKIALYYVHERAWRRVKWGRLDG